MTATRAWMCVAAAGAAAALLAPAKVEAYTPLGHGLDLSQRHVRIYNDFGDPAASFGVGLGDAPAFTILPGQRRGCDGGSASISRASSSDGA